MHAILVHGWKGWPENAWFPWLQKELEARGWTTKALKMPDPLLPRRDAWVGTIIGAIRDPETVLVGHSLGCPAILWALEEYAGPPFAKVVCVSGFIRPFLPLGTFREEWFPHALDIGKVRPKARAWSVIHAKFDPLVPFKEGAFLAAELGVPLTVTKRIGHLTQKEGALEVPEILSAVLDV
jgi:hypothetical protein